MSNMIRGADTRQAILDVSSNLFSKNGYDATSVAEICQQAHVSKGAFYHHFASKQDLFLALMEMWLISLESFFQLAGQSVDTVPQMLENMVAFSGGLFDALEGGFPILLEFWTQASRHPAVWERAVAPYKRYLDMFSNMFQFGVDEGSFTPDITPEFTARILTSMVMGLLLQATFDPDGANWQDVTRFGLKTMLKGMEYKQ